MENKFEVVEPDPVVLAAETLGRDLLSAVVDELKVAPDAWQKLSQMDQDRAIQRLRERVTFLVQQALTLLFKGHYPACTAEISRMSVGDDIKLQIRLAKTSANLHEMADAVGTQIVIVVARADEYTQRMEEVRAKAAQGDLFEMSRSEPELNDDLGPVIVDRETGEILDPEQCAQPPTPPSPDSLPATGSP